MIARLMTLEDIPEFMGVSARIHEAAWPQFPFVVGDAVQSMVDHISHPDAAIIIINDGARKAMMSLEIVSLVANRGARVACETAWGATQPAPRKTAERLLGAASEWAKANGASSLQVCLSGNRKGAIRMIERLGGKISHTAGEWRL